MLQLLVNLQTFIADHKRDDEGATAVEYGLMLALIAGAIILAVATLGDNMSAMFTDVDTDIQGGTNGFGQNPS